MTLDTSFDIERPPAGAWLQRDSKGWKIGATLRGVIIWLIAIAFMASAVTGIAVIMSAGPFRFKDSPTEAFMLFASPLQFAIGVAFLRAKVEVRVDETGGLIFEGVGPIGRRRQFDPATVTEVRLEETVRDEGEKGQQIVIFAAGKQIGLASLLATERKGYLFRGLQQLLTGKRV